MQNEIETVTIKLSRYEELLQKEKILEGAVHVLNHYLEADNSAWQKDYEYVCKKYEELKGGKV